MLSTWNSEKSDLSGGQGHTSRYLSGCIYNLFWAAGLAIWASLLQYWPQCYRSVSGTDSGGGLGGTCPPPQTSQKIGLTNTSNRPNITVPPLPVCVPPLDYPFWIRPRVCLHDSSMCGRRDFHLIQMLLLILCNSNLCVT